MDALASFRNYTIPLIPDLKVGEDLEKLKKLPLESRKKLPLVVEMSVDWLEFLIAGKLEYLSQFKYGLNGKETRTADDFLNEKIRCLVEIMSFFQHEMCPLSEEAKIRFRTEYYNLDTSHSLPALNEVSVEFQNDPNYQLVKGNPKNGIVVLYPQIHHFAPDVKKPDYQINDLVVQSQLDILRDLLEKKAEHLYNEGVTAEGIRNYTHVARTYTDQMSYLFLTIQAIQNKKPLDNLQKQYLEKIGAVTMYFMVSQAGLIPQKAILYPTTTADTDKKAKQFIKGQSGFSQLNAQDLHFIFEIREAELAQAVIETTNERDGKPAYIIMGALHQFEKAFLQRDAPALYRKK